jgi:hypothetical protein
MTNNRDERNSSRNGTPDDLKRIDVDPPYPPATADAVEQLRSLLANLIARTITDDRNKPPAAGDIDG